MPWNKTVWVVTAATILAWIGVSGWMLYGASKGGNVTDDVVSLILWNVIMAPMVLICEGLAPQRLEIGHDKIVILRRYRSVTIRREQIASVERLPDGALRSALRTCGVGGLFGYYGRFYTRKIGSFSLYATRLDNLFLITLCTGKRVVISCAEPDKMEPLMQP